jgi:hypothetical protein
MKRHQNQGARAARAPFCSGISWVICFLMFWEEHATRYWGHDCNECFLHHQNMEVRVHAITSTRRLLPSFQMHEQRRYDFVL